MIALEQQTWATLIGMAGCTLALAGYLHNVTRGLRTDLRAEIVGCRSELRGDIAGLRTELKGDIAGLRTELKGDIAGVRTKLKGDIAELRREMKSEFGKVEGRLTTLEQRTYDLSTRLPPAPAQQSS